MRRAWMVAALVIITTAASAAQQIEPRLIAVSGNAELKLDPDKVDLQIGIVSRGANPAEALAKNQAAEQKLTGVASRFGVAKGDIDAGYTALTYAERTKERTQPYYEAEQGITVTLHDVSKYGDLLAALLSAGANRIDSVTFGVSNLPELRKKVRAMAVHAAREKAEQLAQESGVRIVRVHSISEESGDRDKYVNGLLNVVTKSGEGEAFSIGSPVITGRISVTLSVNASYEIE